MTTRAFQKIYTKIDNITKATVTLRAQGVGNDELATVGGKLAQVVKIMGENVTLQVFAGTEGLATDSEVVFHGEPPKLRVSDNLAGRFFNAYGEPLEGGEIVEGEAREIGGPTVNPYRRIQPSELIATGIAGIDLNNTIVTGQKIPFFADPDQPYNAVMANVALRAKADKIILGGMGLTNDDFLYFKSVFENAGALDRIVSFVNTTENPPVERLLVPDMALTAADTLAAEGISARVINIHTVKPLDTELLCAAAAETGAVVTAEEHNIIGGLGSAVAETLAENCPVPMVRVGVRDSFGRSGKVPELLALYGLTPEALCDAARRAVAAKKTGKTERNGV